MIVVLTLLADEPGDVFSTAKLRKGFEDLRKLLRHVRLHRLHWRMPIPSRFPDTDKIDLTLNFDEGHQFFVRRIDFSGNTTTRDKVIRRELLVDEGDVFNKHLWELSILRLNQLGYFEVLKEEEAADISKDNKNDTVDITLKVKERDKNSIQLQGGVSGIWPEASSGCPTPRITSSDLGESLGLSTAVGHHAPATRL